MPRPQPQSQPTGPAIARLNPTYFIQNRLVPLGLSDGRLAVGMRDIGDRDTIAVLRLATGFDIDPVAMSAAEIATLLDSRSHPQSAQSAPKPHRSVKAESLLDRLFGWVRGEGSGGLLLPLAQLLDAGYDPKQSAEVLLRAQSAGLRFGPTLAHISARLASGTALGTALLETPEVPRWMADAVASCHRPADEPAALAGTVLVERDGALHRENARRLVVETALLSLLVIAAWLAISVWAGCLAALPCLLALAHVGSLTSRHPRNDTVRGEVLAITAVLAKLHVPTASAIRCTLARLNTVAPTGARLPDCRGDLAIALGLPPLWTALLMRGELGDAASRVSTLCAERGRRATANSRWLVYTISFVLFALALVVLIA